MMLHNLPTLEQFLRLLQQVPYLASKNVYRVATHFLEMENGQVDQFCASLLHLKKQIIYCQTCFFWQEKDRGCIFCTNSKRDSSIVCVVETWQAVMILERSGGYNGLYHVLTGVLSPLDGVGPEQLTVNQLVVRAQSVQEIVMALSQTPEGEATAAYIATQLKELPLTMTCLSRGIPIGSPVEAMDRLTVYKALLERRPF